MSIIFVKSLMSFSYTYNVLRFYWQVMEETAFYELTRNTIEFEVHASELTPIRKKIQFQLKQIMAMAARTTKKLSFYMDFEGKLKRSDVMKYVSLLIL